MQGTPHIASTPHDGRSSPIPPARGARQQYPPHRAAAPRVAPAAARPDPDDEVQLPVFVDQSGWRKRTLQGMALVVGSVCVGYLVFVGTVVSGLRQPVGTHPPSTTDTTDTTNTTNRDIKRADTVKSDGQVPSGGERGKSAYGSSSSARSAPPPAGATEQ
ncbi:hypothetical protein [Streptomyces sp. NPDC087300]|uniref:hypothetical protein n=1 Tax=Streptomyces sp. NPDC087300 TaxID=3365780 RepID=UPI0037F11163